MPKKLHPADIADRVKIETATHFNVHLRTSATDKINQEAPTLRAAIRAVDEIGIVNGKTPMIYAVTPEKFTVFVPKDMIDAERALMAADAADDEAMKEPLTSSQIAQLSAILTGGDAVRSNTKAAAEARFVKIAAEHGIEAEKAADFLQGPFSFAEHILREKISGKHMTIEQVEAIRPAAPEAFATRATELFFDGADPKPAKPKREKAPAAPKAEAPASGKRAAALEAAQRGILPEAPDFSADTHQRFRSKLEKLIELATEGDVEGLRSMEINPVSSSPKAMDKFRNLAVIALEAKAAK